MRNIKIRKIAISMVITSLLLTSTSLGFANEMNRNFDKEMQLWYENGITGVYTEEVKSNSNVTVAELSYVLSNLMSYDETDLSITTENVDYSKLYAQSVLKCVTFDIIDFNTKNIIPNSDITKQNAWTMIAKAFNVKPVEHIAGSKNNIILLENQKYVESLQNMGVSITQKDILSSNKGITWEEASSVINELMVITGFDFGDNYSYFNRKYISTFSETSIKGLVNGAYQIYVVNGDDKEGIEEGVKESAIDFYGVFNQSANNFINIKFSEKLDENFIDKDTIIIENGDVKIDRIVMTSDDIITIYLDKDYAIWADESTFNNVNSSHAYAYQAEDLENIIIKFNKPVYDLEGNAFDIDAHETFNIRNIFLVQEGN